MTEQGTPITPSEWLNEMSEPGDHDIAWETPDGRNPKQCSKCGNWCLYDGWDHAHANGLSIESCTSPAPAQAVSLLPPRGRNGVA